MRIEPVSFHNQRAVLALETAPGQEGFIESPRECLEEAAAIPNWKPVALCVGSTVVGFAMYGAFPQYGNRLWLDRLLIDRKHQGKGYGSQALTMLVAKLAAEYDQKEIYLSIYEENELAQGMYERHGFRFTGELDLKGEKIMVLRLDDSSDDDKGE